jgi:predicted Zn finger-like uncharacterized protein
MIIQCPSCDKRYFVEAQAIQSQGRVVRCVACGETWSQHPTQSPPLGSHLDHAETPLDIKKPTWKQALQWIIVFSAVGFLGISIYVSRYRLVDYFPSTKPWISRLGLNPHPPGHGLLLKEAQVLDEDNKKLVIRGTLANNSTFAQVVPPITIILEGNYAHASWWNRLLCKIKGTTKSCKLLQWDHALSERRLFPQETLVFETPPRPMVDGIEKIRVEFS